MALMELIAFDEQGNCLGGSFMDYLSRPRWRCPTGSSASTVTPSPHHPIGAKGVGESATVGLAAGDRQRGHRRAQALRRPPHGHAAARRPACGRRCREGGAAAVISPSLAAGPRTLRDGGDAVRARDGRARAAPDQRARRRRGARARATARSTGFVGGALRARSACACTPLRALETGEPLLLRIVPGPRRRGARERGRRRPSHNPCLSGGALEIFLEPLAARAAPGRDRARRRSRGRSPSSAARRGSRSSPTPRRHRAATRRGGRRLARPRRGGRAARRAERRRPLRRARGEPQARRRRCRAVAGVPEDAARARPTRRPGSTSARGRRRRSPCRSWPRSSVRRARAASGAARSRRHAATDCHPMAQPDRLSVGEGCVLAAGGSRRLGPPKQLLPYGGGTLLDHVLDTARACGFDQLVCRPRRGADDVRATVDLRGADVVVNASYGTGCSSSIAAALAHGRPARPTCSCSARRPAGRAAGDRARRCWPAAATRRWPPAATRTGAGTRSRSRARRSATSRRCTATRPSGGCSTSAPADVAEVAVAGRGPARRRHLGGLRGRAAA